MRIRTSTYVAVDSPVHRVDARVKIALLFAFTICLLLAETWLGILGFSVALLCVMLASRVPLPRYLGVLVPVYVLMAFTVIFNLPVDANGVGEADVLMWLGPLALHLDGLLRGCFFALRILLLTLGSMVVCYTATSTELTAALDWVLRPLRRLHVPVDDMTTVLAIALRFIPLLAAEIEHVHDAHLCRGARFDGGLIDKLKAWGGVFVPVFVRLFGRANRLASAMDARCYGLPGVERSELAWQRSSVASGMALGFGLVFFVLLAIFL